ncbi:MAG TPA: hypothetical protein VFP53_06685 [Sphingomicrobium sp.]|nr:hypothetical protein [Sphingomicrobium sp.]
MSQRAGTTSQRIRIGLTGLAFAFLLVLLGSIVSRSGSDENAVAAAAAAEAATNTPKEPLAELGVAPGSTADETENESSPAKQ